jgi:hypothetical protein
MVPSITRPQVPKVVGVFRFRLKSEKVIDTLHEHAAAELIEALCYKRMVSGSFPDEAIGFFNEPNSSSRSMALRSTQLLTEISTRHLPGGKGRPRRKSDNLTAICEPVGAPKSHNPLGLHGLLQG